VLAGWFVDEVDAEVAFFEVGVEGEFAAFLGVGNDEVGAGVSPLMLPSAD